jgi:hypothetical protein
VPFALARKSAGLQSACRGDGAAPSGLGPAAVRRLCRLLPPGAAGGAGTGSRGTGRFNLARGTVGALSGIAAAVSTAVTGYAYQRFGHLTGFLVIAVIAARATALLWLTHPETKPEKYAD